MKNPYKDLPSTAFWNSGVATASPFSMADIYRRKWAIPPGTNIVTAGSCFAQHIARHLRQRGIAVADKEPAPPTLPPDLHQTFGYSMYSARYGNIYTTAQLLQLAREALQGVTPEDIVWERDGRYFDALRPAVEPEGLTSAEDVRAHRDYHIARVRELFVEADLMIITLGLTEAWINTEHGTVYPTAPGTIAGHFDPARHAFRNFRFGEVLDDFRAFQDVLTEARQGRPLRFMLTVSPVPLTATASGDHVLVATGYSKAVLRAVAGELAAEQEAIDYFPSFEIITNQAARGTFYESNLRSVRNDGVGVVMDSFFAQHGDLDAPTPKAAPAAVKATADAQGGDRAEHFADREDVQCEEAVLEAFSR